MELHERLIARQTDSEIKRKQAKARRKGFWTQEDVDAAYRTADHWIEFFSGESKPTLTV